MIRRGHGLWQVRCTLNGYFGRFGPAPKKSESTRPVFSKRLGGALTTGRFDCIINYGYNLARMRHEIILSPEAVEDLAQLSARDRSLIRAAIEKRLRYAPEVISKSSVKKLRGMSRPQYRLRVSDYRVYYDVIDGIVEILAIVSKRRSFAWLEKYGEADL